ncbi:MAG: Uma2 family endonuclease [Cyanophyceae cyanobacterium]
MPATPTHKKLSFAEYLSYDDGTDNCYELVHGELILMNPPTGRHALIIFSLHNALLAEINRLKFPWVVLQSVGIRTSVNRARIPDLCIVAREQMQKYLEVSAVLEFPALLAVEIVSDSSSIIDYRYKRSEYSVAGIPEYWIIDPAKAKVTVLQLIEGFYEEKEYQGDDKITSPTFPKLDLTVKQILQV